VSGGERKATKMMIGGWKGTRNGAEVKSDLRN
jgi:hypothetical protein